MSEQQHWTSTKASNAPKQEQDGKQGSKYSSQVPNTGSKDNIVGGDEKAGGNKLGFKKFNKNQKKHNVLASSEAEVVTSTEPVIGDGNSGIKAELSTAASPASNGNQATTVKKRRPKNKKVEDKSSSVGPVLEAVSLEESPISVPKPKHSGSGNRKSSSAKVFNFNNFRTVIVLPLLILPNRVTVQFSEGGGKKLPCGGAQKSCSIKFQVGTAFEVNKSK